MITTQYVNKSNDLVTIRGRRKLKFVPHMVWDDSTTPPTLLAHRGGWHVVKRGGIMHPFFFFKDTLYSVPSTTEKCSPVKVFSGPVGSEQTT